MKLQDLLYSQVLENSTAHHKGHHMRGAPRKQTQPGRWGASGQGTVRTSVQVALLGVTVEYTSKLSEGISLLSFHYGSQVRNSKKRNLWEGQDFSRWYTWSPKLSAHSLFVGAEAAGKYDILKFTI